MSTVKVGDPAPDFVLPGTDGTPEGHRDYSLGELAGRPVVLVFYPGDNTPVCTRQLNSYTSDIDAFREVDAQVLAISPQTVESHDAFSSDQGGFAFPLLADTDKAVGKQYGILGPVGFYRRSIFVIDGGGVVRHAHRAVAGLWFRPTDELVAAVAAAG
jgi:thioredoxin-dependent peroxiredoxin